MSSTQQLILTLLSDWFRLMKQTSSGILTRCLKGTIFVHEVIVQKYVPVRV